MDGLFKRMAHFSFGDVSRYFVVENMTTDTAYTYEGWAMQYNNCKRTGTRRELRKGRQARYSNDRSSHQEGKLRGNLVLPRSNPTFYSADLNISVILMESLTKSTSATYLAIEIGARAEHLTLHFVFSPLVAKACWYPGENRGLWQRKKA